MDKLLEKYNDYMRLSNCKAEYELSNGQCIEFYYQEENFAHLIGLHKLKDIQLIQFWQDKNNKTIKLKEVIRRIKNSTFTDAVINFNPSTIKSKIKSDYLLFEEKNKNEFNHLGIALDQKNGKRYVETFFNHPNDMYIAGQSIVKVERFTLYDSSGKIIIEDRF